MADNLPDNRKTLNPSISLIKVIAMYLIIQSHSDILFPYSISFLATGGALGNELFFLVGGYLYSTRNGIGKTTAKRFIRLYIPTYIMTFILYVFRVLNLSDLLHFREIVYRFLWPTSFWFVSAIFIYGVILHFLVQKGLFSSKHAFICFSLLIVVIDIIIYMRLSPKNIWMVEDAKIMNDMVYYKCIYSFIVFCIGYWMKQNESSMKSMDNHERHFVYYAIASVILFYGFKLVLNRGIVPMEMQIISQPITVLCVICIFLWITRSPAINKWLDSSAKVNLIVNELGSITLEAFLIQFELIKIIASMNISFPLNYLLAIVTVVAASYVFHFIDTRICKSIIALIGI